MAQSVMNEELKEGIKKIEALIIEFSASPDYSELLQEMENRASTALDALSEDEEDN
jgi:hypothetical protein